MGKANIQTVGIIGAGRIGQAMAQTAHRAGRQVVIANSHGPQSLTSVVEGLGDGVSAGTAQEAAAADIVVLAVMWPDVPQAVEGLEWGGRIVIDPTNDFDSSDLDGRTSSEVVAELISDRCSGHLFLLQIGARRVLTDEAPADSCPLFSPCPSSAPAPATPNPTRIAKPSTVSGALAPRSSATPAPITGIESPT